jgi:diguanylate cyclase (GGDEF)-like protein/PAS domain S-box-containing protein
VSAEPTYQTDEAWLRLIAEHSRDLVLLLDLEGRILYASPSHVTVLGRNPGDVIGLPVSEFIHPDDREIQRRAFLERLQTGEAKRLEVRILKADGDYIPVESLGVAIRNAANRIEAVVISGREITERKLWEEESQNRELRLRMILERTPALLWNTDRDLRFTSAIGGGLIRLGLEPSELVGLTLFELFQTADPAFPAIAAHRRALEGEAITYEIQWAQRVYQSHAEPLRDATGSVIGVSGVTIDVTDSREAQRNLRRSEARYRTLFERNLAGVYRSSLDGEMLECNHAFARVLGFDSVEEIMSRPTWEHYFSPADREAVIEALKDKTELLNFEICLKRKDGSPVWVLQNEALVWDEDAQTHWMEGTIIDITARKTAEDRIEHQAYHDHLTDLPNRLLFNDRLSLAVAQSRRHRERLTVMFLDLDHFKLINDTMAHSAGDELLRSVSSRLQNVVRQEDTVARMGGDEFTLLLPDVRDEKDAAKIAQGLLEALRAPFFIQGREVFVTGSIGVSMYPSDGTDADTLIKNADSAMYRAKDVGRDNFQFYTPLAQHRAEARLSMETALRHALERGEFFLEYQPQVSLQSGRVVGVEALIRWRHPERGVVPPKEFISLAEEIGLILPIGEWVLRTACEQTMRWQREKGTNLRIAVNLSARQLQSATLLGTVERVLTETGLAPGCLDLEVTESLAMRDTDLTSSVLRQLKRLGIKVSMDDFGTGYSSLSYLKNLPIDRLKIDQLFVREIASNRVDETIVDAVIKMAHSIGLTTVAEGVETVEQNDILARLGCDDMQGFLYSRPLPVERMSDFVGKG